MTTELSELPEGTVTVLFTDVVGSTELTNRLGDEPARKLLRTCDDLVREEVERHGGNEVKGTGDGLMIAFRSARKAVLCAIGIQDAVADMGQANAGNVIGLRIGLNTGEVVREDADLFGATVNAASRIAMAGHAGDILISEAVKIMLGAATTVELEERGLASLKGFDDPWPLYSVIWRTVPLPSTVEVAPIVDAVKVRLPSPRSDVIGREEEIENVLEALSTPNRRLVTLVGPGGVGKTTLSIEVGRRFANERGKPVTFVALDAVSSVERLPVAMTDALGLRQLGQADPRERLLDLLRDQEVLLILDNFEHLIDGVVLIGEILDAAPEVRLLVSSRQALGLRGEWRYRVSGLPVPEVDEGSDADTYAAVQLFAQRAKQARSDFSLEREHADAARICRLVEGVPLALELAASWAATLSCNEIADEIERSSDFLESGLRDVPSRHRSMRAVFEQSWERLTDEEQRTFARLSIFRGGFERGAANQIAGDNLTVLASLVNKSLVRTDADGRYRLHELLRQYAEEKLNEVQEDVQETRHAHRDYYIGLLEEQGRQMEAGNQLEAAEAIEKEFDNLMLAWQCAMEDTDGATIKDSIYPLSNYMQFRGRYSEGYSIFLAAADMLRGHPQTPDGLAGFALCLVEVGWFCIRLGRIGEAREALTKCLRLHDEGAVKHVRGFSTEPWAPLAVVSLIEGDYKTADELAHKALSLGEEFEDGLTTQLALYVLTSATAAAGRFEEARDYGLRAYSTAKGNGDRWFMAYCLNELGSVVATLGDYEQAREYQNASYELRREFDDPEGMAVALNRLGDIAMLEGEHQRAAQQYRRAVAIYREINDRGGLADALRGLGESSRTAGSSRQAATYYREALEILNSIGHLPMTLSTLAGAGELLVESGKNALGYSLLKIVRDHASSEEETAVRAREALSRYESSEQIPAMQLDAALSAVDAELLGLERHAEPGASDDALFEPLTAREQEVLERVADGRSNSEIAEDLIVSIGTVKAHTGNIYSKLDVHNRVQAVARAKELGLLPV